MGGTEVTIPFERARILDLRMGSAERTEDSAMITKLFGADAVFTDADAVLYRIQAINGVPFAAKTRR